MRPRTPVLLLAVLLAACSDAARDRQPIPAGPGGSVDARTTDGSSDASELVDAGGERPDSGAGDMSTDSSARDVGMSDAASDLRSSDAGSDTATADGSMVDLGSPDVGPNDVGAPDLRPPDLGPPDLGPPDLSSPDLGSPDLGPTDLGPMDAGVPDFGRADAAPDMVVDAQIPDVGPDLATDMSADLGTGTVCPPAMLGTFSGQCDPVRQTGCATPDCIITLSISGPNVIISSACLADGKHTLPEGADCLGTEQRCAPGLFCMSFLGVCTRLCDLNDATGCVGGEYCLQASPSWSEIGYCGDTCPAP